MANNRARDDRVRGLLDINENCLEKVERGEGGGYNDAIGRMTIDFRWMMMIYFGIVSTRSSARAARIFILD